MRSCLLNRALILVISLAMLTIGSVQAGQNELLGVRMWPSPEMTRLVFDISSPVKHKVFSLPSPNRIVIDMKDVKKN